MRVYLTSGKAKVQVSSAEKPVQFKAYLVTCFTKEMYEGVRATLQAQGHEILERSFRPENELPDGYKLPRWAKIDMLGNLN